MLRSTITASIRHSRTRHSLNRHVSRIFSFRRNFSTSSRYLSTAIGVSTTKTSRVKTWLLKRELPATWMYFWLLSAQSFKVFGLMFALWKYRKEQIQSNIERSRHKFEEELFGVEQKALRRNPDLMLNTIQIYFKTLSNSEPHKRNISVLAKLLITNRESVFVKRSELDTDEGVLLFDKIDRDGNGELTRNELLEFLATVSKREAIEDLSIITGCDQSVLSTFVYVSLSPSHSHTLTNTQFIRYELEHLKKKSQQIDEKASLDLAKGDYWLMLVEKGDERAVEIDQIRLHLLDILEKTRDCHERNVLYQDSDAMKCMLLEQPLSKNVAKRVLKYLEPLMMACYRKQKHQEKEYTRSSAFEFLERYYDIERSGAVDPYHPSFTLAESIVRICVKKKSPRYNHPFSIYLYLYLSRTTTL